MLYPLNKYLVIKPMEEEKTNTGVLVPDGFKIDNENFKLVEIIEPNIDSKLKTGMRVLVPSHLVEEASFFGEQYYLVTENHVVGFYEEN